MKSPVKSKARGRHTCTKCPLTFGTYASAFAHEHGAHSSLVVDQRPSLHDKIRHRSVDSGSDKVSSTGSLEVETPREKKKSSHTCPICAKTFAWRSNLVNHERAVHSEPNVRPFKCKICERTFKSMENCIDHSFSHAGDRPYECELCYKRFAWRTSISNHKRRMHSVVH